MEGRRPAAGWITEHRTALLLSLIVLIGAAFRIFLDTLSVTGDEVSTIWIVKGNSLRDAIHLVKGDAEITPPLNFVLAWFAVRLGDAPELVRLPAMISGITTIPLVFWIGRKTISERAGLIAAAVFALSPFMIFFSANGRAYTLMILFLAGSTIAMLIADETGRARWWVAYGLLSCLAMYSHYTSFFILAAQMIWLLFMRPGSRLPALLASAGAAVLFLPWLAGLRSDLNSPTTKVLEALQGDGFAAKRGGIESWAFGHPFLIPSQMPGSFAMMVITAGIVGAVLLTIVALRRRATAPEETDSVTSTGTLGPDRLGIPSGLWLVLSIALAAPAGEFLLSLVGTDLFGARNMTPSWYGLALLIGALLAIPRDRRLGRLAVVCMVLVIGGYGFAAAKLTQSQNRIVDFKGPAEVIDSESEPGDVVVDSMARLSTPVPLTPLDLHSSNDLPDYPLGLPTTPPPFLAETGQDMSPQDEFTKAFKQAAGHKLFFLVPELATVESAAETGRKLNHPIVGDRLFILPEQGKIVKKQTFPSYLPTVLYTVEVDK